MARAAEPEMPAPDPMAPRRNPDLIGHAGAEAVLAQAASIGRLPGGLLLSGPRGIGKATLAFRFARWLLATGAKPPPLDLLGGPIAAASLAVDPEDPAVRRIAAGGHADLFTVERAWDAKRKKQKTEIAVDDVRAVSSFLHLTSAEGGWRIVIIDGAEEMSRSAANALLKILEEPPRRALLMLVSHAPGRLPPTVRSRCRSLVLQTLATDEVAALLARYRPALEANERAALAALGEGSIGRALDLADAGGLELYRSVLTLLAHRGRAGTAALHRFAERIARSEEAAFDVFVEMLLDVLARGCLAADGSAPRLLLPEDEPVLARLAGSAVPAAAIGLWDHLKQLFARADAVNLDRKQVVLDAFLRIGATFA